MKYPQYQWCQDLNIEYSWVKGHTYRGNEEPTRDERLHIEADELCDTIMMEATDPIAGALFIRGIKVTEKMKKKLEKQVHGTTLRRFLIEKEMWTSKQLDGVDWKSCVTVSNRWTNCVKQP
jgi:hypothetical protein